ncbi:hypothetical protein OQA88_12884 [Cercophora sp. LCS_1]
MESQTRYTFPFGLATAGTADHEPSTANAADSHLMELQMVMGNQEDDGDVLAVINLDGDLAEARACGGSKWQSMSIRMKSERLLGLGSSKITKMFSTQRQERTRRRLQMGILPPGVAYVLDFTPPSEGAELADLTAALWLPHTVKLWFLAGHYIPDLIVTKDDTGVYRKPLADKSVGAILALGHDDACKSESCLIDLAPWKINPETAGIFDVEGADDIPSWRRIEDYCRIRHCAAIMRVLRAINGHGLLLNSATRMWTVAQVAIHLEVPQVVVDPVTQWLLAAPNTKFIEICPEKAFQLAFTLKIPSVLVASFRILVSEQAIDYAATIPSPRRPSHTWAQRRRDEYGDFPSDPVEYASRAFADRMANILDTLQSNSVHDSFERRIVEWDRLRALAPAIKALPDNHRLKAAHQTLMEALVAIFHRKVTAALNSNIVAMLRDLVEAQRRHYVPISTSVPITTLYGRLSEYQKVMTNFFWNSMRGGSRFDQVSESTFRGRQLWRIVQNYNTELNSAVEAGTLQIFSHEAPGEDGSPQYYPFPVTREFRVREYCDDVCNAMPPLCDRMTDRGEDNNSIVYFLSNHLLLSLDEAELNFLPIWAGGLDDGSGGVFQDPVPPTDMGPSEPGPGYHTGHTVGAGTDASAATMTDRASTIAPSDLGIGDLDIYTDAGIRSIDANQSVTTAPPRGRVVAMSDSIESEQFSTTDSVFADARYEVPSSHQAVGQALAQHVEDDGASTVDDGNSVAWSYVGSVANAGAPDEHAAPVAPTTGTSVDVTISSTGHDTQQVEAELDCFGLEDDEGDDFDDTSTLDGSDLDVL